MASIRMSAPTAQRMMGSTLTGCNLVIMKGTAPTDFVTSFTSLSTRSSDILVNMGGVAAPTDLGQQGTGATATWRFLVGLTSGPSWSVSIPGGSYGGISRTSNVATMSCNTGHGFLPNQQITISGSSPDASFNGTQTVLSVPSPTSFTFASVGANNPDLARYGTATAQLTAIASGTASWFCLKSNALIPTGAFTGGNAVIGTIGVAGSGADMEIASTTITNGSAYSSAGFYLNIPANWTF